MAPEQGPYEESKHGDGKTTTQVNTKTENCASTQATAQGSVHTSTQARAQTGVEAGTQSFKAQTDTQATAQTNIQTSTQAKAQASTQAMAQAKIKNSTQINTQASTSTHAPASNQTISTPHRSSSPRPQPRPVKTGWIYNVNKQGLQMYLRECGIDDYGIVEELRRRLSNFVSGGNYDEIQWQRFQELEQRHTPTSQGTSQTPNITADQAATSKTSLPTPHQTSLHIPHHTSLHTSLNNPTWDNPSVTHTDPTESTHGQSASTTLTVPQSLHRGNEYPIDTHEDTTCFVRSSIERDFGEVSTRHTAVPVDDRTFKRVRKWDIRFNGKDDAIDFIDRIEELASSQLDQIPFVLCESMSDSALSWWRNRRSEWTNWAQFKTGFLKFFLPPLFWDNLDDEIRQRKQRKNEPFKTYVLEMESLMRHTNLTALEKLDRIYKNSSPTYQMFIQRRTFTTLDELTELVIHIEAQEVQTYHSHKGTNAKTTEMPRQTPPQRQSQHKPQWQPQRQQEPRRNTENPFGRVQNPHDACRKCAQSGHQGQNCRNQPVLFCWECGQRGRRTNECCRQGNPQNVANKTHSRGVRKTNQSRQDLTPTSEVIKVGPPRTDGRSIEVDIQVREKSWYGIIDTGSINSFISAEAAKQIPATIGVEENYNYSVRLANGQCQKVRKILKVTMQAGEQRCTIPLLIMPKPVDHFLLGMDFFSGTSGKLSLSSGNVDMCKMEPIGPTEPERIKNIVRRKKSKPTSNANTSPINDSTLPQLTTPESKRVQKFLAQELEKFKQLKGLSNVTEHKIVMKDDQPIKQRYYPKNPAMQKIISEKVDELLDKNCIEPSNSPYSAPVVLVRKKNGKWRLCIDYRQLNAKSVPDAYPIPRIHHILDRLRNAKFISSLDLKDGYWQIPMHADSQQYTAFTVPGRGLFHWKVMPFGLHSAPATFQRALDQVIGPDLEPHAFAYLDDIIVTSNTLEEHIEKLGEVFRRLRAAKLRINPEKCEFFKKETKYLGHVISDQGIQTDPEKIEAIKALKPPTNVRELRRCLGVASWYRRFVPSFSKITQPLTELLKKGKHFRWGETQQAAFEEVKKQLTEAPILACPDFNQTFKLQTDASDFGLGAVLTQELDGNERVIAYASRHLNGAEKNYSATEKECLAIVWGIRKMKEYLEGYRFIVITDHLALKWLNTMQNPTGRVARWALELQQYAFDVQYRKGKYNVIADALSRQPQTAAQRVEAPIEANEEVPATTTAEDANTGETLTCAWLSKKMAEVANDPQNHPEYLIENGQLYRNFQHNNKDEDSSPWKLCVGKPDRERVLRENHDEPTAGHVGTRRTITRIASRYHWPGMFRDISKYVRRCEQCQRFKSSQQAPAGQMLSHIPEEPWATVCADFVGPLPRSKHGNSMLLVFQDKFSKWIELIPMRSATAEGVVKAFRSHILARFGTPKMLITDNGTQFTSKVVKTALEDMGVKHQFTAPYTPQENAVERANRIVKTMLAQYAEGNQRTWDELIPEITLAINTGTSEVTGHSAAYLTQGRELRLPKALFDEVTPGTGQQPETPTERSTRLKETFTLVRQEMQRASLWFWRWCLYGCDRFELLELLCV